MKITKKVIAIGIVVLAVAAVLLVYNFVFTPAQEEIETIEKETKVLQEREDELRGHFLSLQRYRKGIDTEKKSQSIILQSFPQMICEEDEIMFIDNAEKNYEIFFRALSYGSLVPFSEFTNDVIQSHMTASRITMTGNYDGTYQGLKDIITHTNNQKSRMIINNLSASYDTTTGLLSGSIEFTMYTVSGSENLYEGPYISEEIKTGRHNIFGTME